MVPDARTCFSADAHGEYSSELNESFGLTPLEWNLLTGQKFRLVDSDNERDCLKWLPR